MGDLSNNFSRYEFACKDKCGFDTVDAELIQLCEEVREVEGGYPLAINSGCRCPWHNLEVGGKKDSLHLKGKAADPQVRNPRKVYDYLCKKYPNKYGFGLYKDFVHVDCRSGRWRSEG